MARNDSKQRLIAIAAVVVVDAGFLKEKFSGVRRGLQDLDNETILRLAVDTDCDNPGGSAWYAMAEPEDQAEFDESCQDLHDAVDMFGFDFVLAMMEADEMRRSMTSVPTQSKSRDLV